MIIDINQKKIAIGEKYKIFIDQKESYFASTELFSWLPELNLFENNKSNAKFTLKKKWSWFKTKYDICRNDNAIFEYRTVSFWKRHHNCKVGNDLYEVFGHNGRKYSVFKNNIQIAWWDKNSVTWFEGDNYKIVADNDCDYELVISFCLINDNKVESSGNNNNIVTIEVGSIGPEAREFDQNWIPKT